MATLPRKSAAGTSTGGKDAPSNLYNIESDGSFKTNNGDNLGLIFKDADLEELKDEQHGVTVTKFEVLPDTGILVVYGSSGAVVGYVVDPNTDETNPDSWILETIHRHGYQYTYIVTGTSEAYAGLGNRRGEPRPVRKVTVMPHDTLIKIVQNYLYDGRRWREIYELNETVIGSDPRVLKTNMVLKLPRR